MLKIDSMTPMEEYMDLLARRGEIYIDNARLDRAMHEAGYISDDYKALALLELRIESGGRYVSVSPDSIIDYLIESGVDMDNRYGNRRTKTYSLDMKRVVDKLLRDGIAVPILSAYKKHRSYKSYYGTLSSLSLSKRVHHTTSDGRYILCYPTTLKQQENLRVYYRDIAVVNIPKTFSNIITGPDEAYHLAWCDYPQADWRFAYNLFIKDDNNFKVMQECEDAYEGLARMVEGDAFSHEAFASSRKEYKVYCLSVFYNSSDKDPIPQAIRAFFRTCPRYSKMLYDLDILYRFKLPVPCTSYFGYTQLLPEASYPDAFISKGMNTPIQTFTSHVVCETVMGLLKKFWDLGYTKEDIDVYYVRHDEPIFLFRDTILKDAWIFRDCSYVHIDGFSPIKLDFHFGDYYQEEDPILTSQVAMRMDEHPERCVSYPVGTMNEYWPIPSVESVYCQIFVVEDGNLALLYDYRTAKYYKVTCGVRDGQESLMYCARLYAEKLGRPQYLYVRTRSMDFMDAIEWDGDSQTLIKAVISYDTQVAVELPRLEQMDVETL